MGSTAAPAVICPECGEEVAPEAVDLEHICTQCKNGKILHPNCFREIEGSLYCLTCAESISAVLDNP